MRARTGFALFVLLGLGVMFASSLNQYGVADKQNVTFYTQVKIGDTIVPAGDYRVLHNMEGDDHVMVFEQKDVPKGKGALVKVKCTMKPLTETAKNSEQHFRNDDGVQVLTMLQFKGDKAQHIF